MRTSVRMRAGTLALTALVFSSLLTACPTHFIEAWEVAEPRLMGVRVEVEGDAGNPRPMLGQSFDLRQYIAVPGPSMTPLASRYSMALALCLGFKTATGTLACIDDQNLMAKLTPISDTEILLSGVNLDLSALGVPAGVSSLDITSFPALANLDRLALLGGFCVDGTAERVPGTSAVSDAPYKLFRCSNNAGALFPDPTTFTLSVYLDRGLPGDLNQDPSFACDPATPDSPCFLGVARDNEPMVGGAFVLASPKPKLKGQLRTVVPWLPSGDPNALPVQDCAMSPGLLQVHAGDDDYVLRARFDPSDRESYEQQITLNGEKTVRQARESLDLTSALTTKGGKLAEFESRLFDDVADAEGEISVTYTPPKQSDDPTENIPQNGRVVRFYFTLRDQRGGLDYAMRELCLVPGEKE